MVEDILLDLLLSSGAIKIVWLLWPLLSPEPVTLLLSILFLSLLTLLLVRYKAVPLLLGVWSLWQVLSWHKLWSLLFQATYYTSL